MFLSSPLFPLIKHCHIMHTLSHENPILPSFDVFCRSTTGHETSNVPEAAGTKFNVAKSHEQHVANAVWSEDLPSNTTLPAKLSSPISPYCMYSFLFMNIAHLYAKYRQKNNLLADYWDSSSSTMFISLCETFLHEGILDSNHWFHYCYKRHSIQTWRWSMSVFKKKILSTKFA